MDRTPPFVGTVPQEPGPIGATVLGDFDRPHPGFAIWLGDGMEFDVLVRESNGQAEVFGGE